MLDALSKPQAQGPAWSPLLPALCLLWCSGCFSQPKEVVVQAPVRTHYTLRVGEVEAYGPPLPAKTDIYVDWHYSNGRIEELTGFHAWDFLGQGRYSMIEVLGEDGRPTHYLYDFDGDGRTDLVIDAATQKPELP